MKQRSNYNRVQERTRAKQARIAQVKRQKTILCATITVFTAVVLLLGSAFFAKTRVQAAEAPATKYYESITISYGDTLTSIAEANIDAHYSNLQDYIDEMKAINNLAEDTIHAGEHLIIPYYVSDAI